MSEFDETRKRIEEHKTETRRKRIAAEERKTAQIAKETEKRQERKRFIFENNKLLKPTISHMLSRINREVLPNSGIVTGWQRIEAPKHWTIFSMESYSEPNEFGGTGTFERPDTYRVHQQVFDCNQLIFPDDLGSLNVWVLSQEGYGQRLSKAEPRSIRPNFKTSSPRRDPTDRVNSDEVYPEYFFISNTHSGITKARICTKDCYTNNGFDTLSATKDSNFQTAHTSFSFNSLSGRILLYNKRNKGYRPPEYIAFPLDESPIGEFLQITKEHLLRLTEAKYKS